MSRKGRSIMLVTVTGILVFAGAILFAGRDRTAAMAEAAPSAIQDESTVPASSSGDTLAIARGRELFREVGCTGCHGAEGVGRDRLLLDSVGSYLPADTLRLWIVDPQAVQPGVRKPAYDDLPAGEVNDLVAYLLSLERPPGH